MKFYPAMRAYIKELEMTDPSPSQDDVFPIYAFDGNRYIGVVRVIHLERFKAWLILHEYKYAVNKSTLWILS